MNKPLDFDGVAIFCFMMGGCIVAFGIFLFWDRYHDHTHPISAQITKTEDACKVGWKINASRVRHYKVMPCADVDAFKVLTPDRNFWLIEGKRVWLSFSDAKGVARTATAFISNDWLAESTRPDEIAINYYPGTTRPVRKVPTLAEAFAMFGFCLLGVFFAASGLLGVKTRRRRAERRKAANIKAAVPEA